MVVVVASVVLEYCIGRNYVTCVMQINRRDVNFIWVREFRRCVDAVPPIPITTSDNARDLYFILIGPFKSQ